MTTILAVPGSNAPNPFCAPIQAFLTSTNPSSVPAPNETAAHLVTMVTTSSDPGNALWQLWDAFLSAAATSSTSHAPHLALLDALQAQPPTPIKNLFEGSTKDRQLWGCTTTGGKLHWSPLPHFNALWRDTHDVLEAWRDRDGVRTLGAGDNSTASTTSSGYDECYLYLRFCAFSAALLKATKGKDKVGPMWVFFACRRVLEHEGPQSHQPQAHRLPPERVWALDVRVAATWMRDGGRVLWETDQEELWEHYTAALVDKTELWPREDGLTRERWQLWGERLRALSTDERNLDVETRAVVTEAAEAVEGILEGN